MVYPKAVRVGNSPNQDPRRADVKQVILHHTASTGDVNDIWNMFMASNSRSVSANFLVAQDGRVFEVVNPDTGRAWTTGSGPGGTISPDHSAITMEVMDETGAPGWTISEAAQEAQAQIIAWAADRYGFEPVRGVNVRGHREMPGQSTACPGGMPLDSIAFRAVQILNGETKPAAPTIHNFGDDTMPFVLSSVDVGPTGDPQYAVGIFGKRIHLDGVRASILRRAKFGDDGDPKTPWEMPQFNQAEQDILGDVLRQLNSPALQEVK